MFVSCKQTGKASKWQARAATHSRNVFECRRRRGVIHLFGHLTKDVRLFRENPFSFFSINLMQILSAEEIGTLHGIAYIYCNSYIWCVCLCVCVFGLCLLGTTDAILFLLLLLLFLLLLLLF